MSIVREIEGVDVEDVDLLTDPKHHARCPICQPQLAFVPFTAVCGARAIRTKSVNITEAADSVCEHCARIADLMCRRISPCPQCGVFPWGQRT